MSDDSDLITRQELADTLGVGKSTICRWEKSGKVKPIIDERGVRKFRVGEIRDLVGNKPIVRLQQAKPYVPSAANASGALAAEIFTRLDRAERVTKIVKDLKVHPDVVLGIGNTWARVAKGLFFRSRHIVTLSNALRVSPTRDADEFMERLVYALESRLKPCSACESNRPVYCHRCTQARVQRAKEEATRVSTPQLDIASST